MKNLYITFVRNGIEVDNTPILTLLKKEGFEPQVTAVDTNFELEYKEFLPNEYGLSGIKSRVREVVEAEGNNIVFFFYKPTRQVHGWTYPNPLTKGDVFIEIPWSEEWIKWTSEAMVHETVHALNRLILWSGKTIEDTMDTYPTALGGVEDNLVKLRPYYTKIHTPTEVLSLMGQILLLATKLLQLFSKKTNVKSGLPNGIAPPNNPVIVEPEKPDYRKMTRDIAKEQGLTDEMTEQMIATVQCESGFNPKAINVNSNQTTDYGICQYNDYWYIGEGKPIPSVEAALNDVELCLRVMAQQFKKGRQRDWICYRILFE